MNLSKHQETVKDREARSAAVHGVAKVRHDLVTEQQQLDGMMQLNGITAAPPPVSRTDIGVGHQLHTATLGQML